MYTYSDEGNSQFIDYGGNKVCVYLRVIKPAAHSTEVVVCGKDMPTAYINSGTWTLTKLLNRLVLEWRV